MALKIGAELCETTAPGPCFDGTHDDFLLGLDGGSNVGRPLLPSG